MTWLDGLTAIAVIVGFVYIIVVKMREKNRGRRTLEWMKNWFNPAELIVKPTEKIREAKEQVYLEKREII